MELQELIENKDILYIYEVGLQIYGLFDGIEDRDFLLIVTNEFVPDKELLENEHYQIININN